MLNSVYTIIMKTIFAILLSLTLCFSIAKADDNKVLITFGADWCKYCRKAKEDMNNNSQLKTILKSYEIIEIDIDVDKDIADGYNIVTIPTFVVFENGKEVNRQTGYNGPSSLIKILK